MDDNEPSECKVKRIIVPQGLIKPGNTTIIEIPADLFSESMVIAAPIDYENQQQSSGTCTECGSYANQSNRQMQTNDMLSLIAHKGCADPVQRSCTPDSNDQTTIDDSDFEPDQFIGDLIDDAMVKKKRKVEFESVDGCNDLDTTPRDVMDEFVETVKKEQAELEENLKRYQQTRRTLMGCDQDNCTTQMLSNL